MIGEPQQTNVPMPTPPRKRRLWPLALVALIVLGGGGFWYAHHKGAGGEGAEGGKGKGKLQNIPPVLAAPVEVGAVPLELAAVGSVEAYSSVAVRAQMAGPLLRVAFAQGQPVKKGQLLFQIDPAPARAALAQAQAQYARDAVQAENARREAARYQGLAAQGFVAREQAEQLRTTASALDATLAADRANVQNAKIQLSYANIYAPIDGVAGTLQLTAGNLIRANDTTPLVTINQVHPVYVNFALPEAEVPRVREHMGHKKLVVTATPKGGAPVDGELAFLDNAVDVATGTLHMKAQFGNQTNQLIPGQFADVKLQLDVEANALTVPTPAVLTGQQGNNVYVLDQDETVHLRPVQVEREAGGRTVIKSGLEPGERVVTDGQLQLVDGAKVRLRENLQPPPGALGKANGPKHGRNKGARPGAEGTK